MRCRFQLKVNMWQIGGYKGNRKTVDAEHSRHVSPAAIAGVHPYGRWNWKLEPRDPVIKRTRLLPALATTYTYHSHILQVLDSYQEAIFTNVLRE